MSSLTKRLHLGIIAAMGWCLTAGLVRANIPGGGTGTGANVALTSTSTTVTMSNGIVSIVGDKFGTINQINYTYNNGGGTQTVNLLGGGHNGGQLYWETSGWGGGPAVYSVVANTGNYAEFEVRYDSSSNGVWEVHFSMLKGSPGFYVTPIWMHRSQDAAMGMGETRDNIYAGSSFNWMSVDAQRNRLMEISGGSAIGVQGAPVEVSLWTNGIYAGQYEDKYKYSADLGVNHVWGWSSVGPGGKNVGLWNISASSEYYNGGPLKRELMEHIGTTILNMLNGGHYGMGSDGSWADGEVWTKVYGPYFIYCNNVTNTLTGTNAAALALYNDALAQGAAEQSAWPYSWFTNANYAPASNRGAITGKFVLNDPGNPNASAAGLWVGAVQQPATSTGTYDFQQWMKPYQFWVHSDTNGNFTIPNVIAGANYTLYAFGPGTPDTFMSQAQTGGNPPLIVDYPASQFGVAAAGGATNNLGTVTWTPVRVGATVFEIGYPDRTAAKFRHGDDWWVGDIGPGKTAPSPVWSKWLELPFDFPNGVNYVVGQGRWSTDWNFVQPVVTDNQGHYNNSSSTITFNLAAAPTNGATASLYLGLASDYYSAIIVTINGNNLGSVGGVTGTPNNSIPTTGYYPGYSRSDTTIREGNQAAASDERLTFPASLLHAGANTITIGIRQIGGSYFADHAMYDYIRLELTGYVPPAPASVVVAYPGNNCNLVCWPVTPGATSYNILRSTTPGSGYVSITNGVTGPVCGSGAVNATWLDTTAGNGTNYYYVVKSVNPTGSSTDSPQSSGATPSSEISASAPTVPTGLAVGSVAHHSVPLSWNASAGANYYSVYRSTLANSGGGSSNVLSTILLNNAVTSTSFTDASPTDGSIYSYVVTATDADGTSANSAAAIGVALPAAPATPPASLFITSVATTNPVQNVALTWNPVAGAVGYAIYRATSPGGPYVFLQSVTETTYYDGGLAANQTYYYRVVALNAAGTSAYATDLVNPDQAAPTNLVATATNAQITLGWSATPGATSYTVKRGTSAGGETVTVTSGYTGTTYTDTGLANGTPYYYVVTADGAGGTSGNSPEASATPLATGDGIWIADADGDWGATANWSGGSVASGSGHTADFSTLSLSSNLTVTLNGDRTISGLFFGDTAATYNWTLTGTNTLTLGTGPNIGVVNQSATVGVPIAGTNGLVKTGAGALTLTAGGSITGNLTVNAGSLALDFSAANSPAANIVPAANRLTLGGGALQITGGSNTVSSQTFNGLTLTAGHSVVAAAPVSGTYFPSATLGAISENVGGTVEFAGPATINSNGNVAAAATITTTTSPGTAGVLGGLGLGKNGAYATVGLYDWATTNTAASPYTIVGGSQVPGFYQTTGVTSGGNYDVNSGGVNSIGNAGGASTLRYNQNAALTVNNTAFTFQNCQGILVTPNCGAHNETLSGNTLQFSRSTGYGASYGVIWQNNTLGCFNCSISLGDGRQGGQNNGLVQAGPGTVIYEINYYTLGTYLNGGYSVITAYAGFGQTNNGNLTVSAVTLNGGMVVGNATFTNSQAGANARPFVLGNSGGGLAATAGNTMTVDGVVGSAAGAGPLAIGIPASSANNSTAGLLPGTGPGTANSSPVNATGVVVLNNANNYTGGTLLQSGTLNINGIYALGGANYGGLTFNGGALQYATHLDGSNGSADLTSIGTAGVTLAAGGGTIDLNGNAVTFAGSIGKGGSGSLVVKSSLAGGSLNFQSGNNYSGNTTVTNATLWISNPGGSATGSGDVTVQNGGTLAGDGGIAGSATVAAGGTLAPGNLTGSLGLGNNLTLAAGSTTEVQVQHSPRANSGATVAGSLAEGGTLVVTNTGGPLADGDTFTLFSASSYSGSFDNIMLPPLTGNLVWNTNTLSSSGTISVATLTSPVITGVQIAGTELVVSGSGGVNSWPFFVLASTNLVTVQWTPVATNQFDSNGNFTVTNAISPNSPQMYFRLQLQ